jgi:importin-7
MLPALENFITYGAQTMVEIPSYIEAVVGMVRDIFRDDKVGPVDRICGCKLAESIMLNLRGHVDQYIQLFIELAMDVIQSDDIKVKSYRIHLLEVVINAIYYNPILADRILEAKGWTNRFFSAWFSNIEYMTRVHDKKLSIMAICSLMTLKADQIPTSVQLGWPRLMQGIVKLFQTLPAAEKSGFHYTPLTYIYICAPLAYNPNRSRRCCKGQRLPPVRG